MKVLLVGDFSSLHKNLKFGLEMKGITTTLLSDGDGWKKIDSDININSRYKGIIREIDLSIQYLKKLKVFKNYNIIQIININTLPGLVSPFILWYLKKNNCKIFISASGDDVQFINSINNMRYSPYSDIEKLPYRRIGDKIRNWVVLRKIDGVIPVMYEYAQGYRNSKYNYLLKDTIPLPIETDPSIMPKVNKNGKILIFHGIIREDFKGTKYIKSAMEKIKTNYPNKVEILIDGKMPLSKYIEILKKTDVVVDQALSYSYAMNALYAMSLGKVVLSGNELECMKELKREDIPVINIKPSEDDIYIKLENLILERNKLHEIGCKSKLFVEDFHDNVKVAEKYLEVWQNSNTI